MKIAFKIFNSEIEDLLTLYNSSLIAFDQTKKVKRYSNEISRNIDSTVLSENLKDFTSDVNSIEYDLRQVILIKLISILEQFLIDNIKFIFTEIKEPFKTDNKIEFQYQELLSFKSLTEVFNKIISRDCRQLSSGGFDKIIIYYEQKFKLDLNKYSELKDRIIEYHDRRHLHVHNLGKTDKKYRKKYNTIKLGVSISDEYLRNAIEDIKVFVEQINNDTLNYIEDSKKAKAISSNSRTICFSFQNLTEKLDLIDDNYGFWSNDDLVILKDILIERKFLPDNYVEIKISGDQNKIKDYFNIIKKTAKSNKKIKFFNKSFDDFIAPIVTKKVKIKQENYVDPKPKVEITDELISKIKSLLPEKPWPIGIHKTIANDLNISNSTIHKIIRIIISNE